MREITSLDELPPLQFCDGQRLLEGCVQEIAPVAEDRGITLRLDAEPALMQCNAAMLQRASFVLLDEIDRGRGTWQQNIALLCTPATMDFSSK